MENLTIAISGQPGSGSTTTSQILADKLKINHFSPGRLFKDVATGKFKEQHYSEIFMKICKEKNLTIPQMKSDYDSSGSINLWNTDFGRSKGFHEAIDKLQVELGKNGNIVIDGKLSLKMIENANPKIWLKADLQARAKRVSGREGLDLEKALEIVKKKQALEKEEWKKIYGIDYWEQEKLADVVIDTTDLTSEQTAQKILESINGKL